MIRGLLNIPKELGNQFYRMASRQMRRFGYTPDTTTANHFLTTVKTDQFVKYLKNDMTDHRGWKYKVGLNRFESAYEEVKWGADNMLDPLAGIRFTVKNHNYAKHSKTFLGEHAKFIASITIPDDALIAEYYDYGLELNGTFGANQIIINRIDPIESISFEEASQVKKKHEDEFFEHKNVVLVATVKDDSFQIGDSYKIEIGVESLKEYQQSEKLFPTQLPTLDNPGKHVPISVVEIGIIKAGG